MDVRNRLPDDVTTSEKYDSVSPSSSNDVKNMDQLTDACPNDSPKTKENPVSSSFVDLKSTSNNLGVNFWAAIFTLFFIGFYLAVGFQTSCSLSFQSTSISPEVTTARFEENRVRIILKRVTLEGHRPTGSEANEKIIPEYLINVLNEFMTIDAKHLETRIDKQLAHYGGYNISVFRQHIVSMYENINNIVFRISDPTSRNISHPSAILINCHYDTVVDSPGASDDFVSCANMLEVIRVLLVARVHLKHDLIFLFNGAEEALLLGSHAFVTQHPWMKDVRLVVNLEAAGAGGRQAVFQTGPNNPWIIKEFAAVAKQPFVSILGQEIFQLGIIPSDTDFRIFRDYGKVPGIDMAYFANGYVYHTKFDTEQRIPPACIQNAGDNLLLFVLRLGNSPYIDNPNLYKGGNMVFFDFLGLFVVSYSFFWSSVINTSCVVFVIIRSLHYVYLHANYAKYLFIAFINHFICLAAVLILLLVQGYVMNYVGNGMSWYAIRYNLIGVYIFPLIWLFFVYHSFISRRHYWPTPQLAEEVHFQAAQIWICIPLFLLTLHNFGSSHFLLIMVIIPFCVRLILERINLPIFNVLPTSIKYAGKELLLYCIPVLYLMNQLYSFFDLFIPIMGRAGAVIIPDVFIAVLVFLSAIIPILYLSGKVYQTNLGSLSSIRFLLLHSTLSYLILVHFSNFGFPYNGSYDMPRKQRIMIIHVNRVFRDTIGTTQSYDSGLWVVPLDRNLVQHLNSFIPELQVTKPSHCAFEPYCGFPYMRPLSNVLTSSYYLPRSPHKLSPSLDLTVVDRVGLNRTSFNVTFNVKGPSFTTLTFMTEPGVEITNWSFVSAQPRPISVPRTTSEKHFYVTYVYGKQPMHGLIFWTVVSVSPTVLSQDAQIRVALSGHYVHGSGYRTTELQSFIGHLPDFVVPTYWSASYERWIIPIRNGARYAQ